jgi:hypothetical protein
MYFLETLFEETFFFLRGGIPFRGMNLNRGLQKAIWLLLAFEDQYGICSMDYPATTYRVGRFATLLPTRR